MKKSKKRGAATSAKAATQDEAPRTASEAIPEDKAGPPLDPPMVGTGPQHVGGDDPQHDEYAEGREALAELCKDTKQKLPTLLKLGRAFVKARTEAMRIANKT